MTVQPMNSGMEEALQEKPIESEFEIVPSNVGPSSAIEMAVRQGANIETIERLVALQERMLARQAEIDFNGSLNRVQSEIKRVAPDLTNSQTGSKYASYAAIDRIIRPLYVKEGLSLSFSEEDCPKPEHVRIICYVSKGAHTRMYRKDMPADGKGAKGGDVMTKTHAAGAADSYAKRYLVKDIFNVAIGEEDADGNVDGKGYPAEEMEKARIAIGKAATPDDLRLAFSVAYKAASKANDRVAMGELIHFKDMRKTDLEAL